MLAGQFPADLAEVMAFAAESPRRRRLLLAAFGLTVAAVITIVIVVNHRHRPPGPVSDVPFTGLHTPQDVAVDDTGTVYVTDSGDNRVLKIAAGSGKQTQVPFAGLEYSNGVAVDGSGAVYVTAGRGFVIKLAGSGEQRNCRSAASTARAAWRSTTPRPST
jgi:DNA-binding beta-propeller fold protein YncE